MVCRQSLVAITGGFAARQVVKGQHREAFRFGRAIAGVAGLRSHLLAAEFVRQVFRQLLEAFGICARPIVRAVPIEEPPLFAVERWRIVGAKPIVDAKVAKNAMSLSTCALSSAPGALRIRVKRLVVMVGVGVSRPCGSQGSE